MDDSNTPHLGLDINPDLITPQSSTPQTTSSTLPPVAPGVIDITPGASNESHSSKIEDITPSGSPVLESNLEELPASSGNASPGVIDITPASSPAEDALLSPTVTPVVTDTASQYMGSASHLDQIIPQQTNPAPTEPASMSTPVSAPTELIPAPTAEITPPVASIAATPLTEQAPASVQAPATPPNPLAEDPDSVKLA